MIVTEANLVQARYITDDRTVIECIVKDSVDTSPRSVHIVVDPQQPLFQELMKICSLEQIDAWSEEYYEAVREEIVTVQRNLIEAGKISYTRIDGPEEAAARVTEYCNMLFQYDATNADHVEKLFNFKLEMFELDEVAIADEDTKAEIRAIDDPVVLLKKLYDIRNP